MLASQRTGTFLLTNCETRDTKGFGCLLRKAFYNVGPAERGDDVIETVSSDTPLLLATFLGQRLRRRSEAHRLLVAARQSLYAVYRGSSGATLPGEQRSKPK